MKVNLETINIDDKWLMEEIKKRVSSSIVQKYKVLETHDLESFIKEEVHNLIQNNKDTIIKMVSDNITKSVMKTKAIKEIEKIIEDLKVERQKCFEEIDYPLSQVDKLEGRILAYTDVVMALNQYNIITAPKSIMLSEIVERLNEEYKEKPIFQRWTKNYKTIHLENRGGMFELSNNKIYEIYLFRLTSKSRWLYELWIAGTEIVDDLESD